MTREEQKQLKEDIRAFVAQGYLREAAEAVFNVSADYVKDACAGLAEEMRQEQHKKILELIQCGTDPQRIAERFGYAVGTVYRIAMENGISVNTNNRVIKKNLPDDFVNAMKHDAESGMISEEISKKYNIPSSAVKEICRGHFTNINQYGLIGTAKSGYRISERIAECLPNWEYAGNYTGTDGKCDIRCKTCGTVKTVCSQAIRKQFARCSVCFERERIEREEQRRVEQEVERKKRQIALEIQRQETIRRKEEQKRQDKLDHTAVYTCETCGGMFLADDRKKNRFCGDKCRKKAHNKSKEWNRRIMLDKQMIDRDISLERLYQRDGGICYLCGNVCDWNDKKTVDGTIICGNNYPSIEHVIPLSKNGKHSWANVRLACRKCNSHKRDRLIADDKRLA